jgi:hypothetical protein
MTEQACTMLIHAMISWPGIIQEQLWPFALCLAVDIHNSTPGPSSLTPEEISGIKGCNWLSDFHPFGCPVFVLDPSLHQGHKIPCWWPCSRVSIYLGLSPEHASSIPLVLSTTSGLVSPQFHVVFDDEFTTTNCLHTNLLPSKWPTLLSTSSAKYVDDDFDSSFFLDNCWFSNSSPSCDHLPSLDPSITPNSSSSQREDTVIPPSSSFQREHTPVSPATLQRETHSDTSTSSPPHSCWNQHHHYSTHFKQRHFANIASIDNILSLPDTPFDNSLYSAFIAVQVSYPILSTHELPFLEHYACASQLNSDILHYGAILCDPDRTSFETDMQRNISDLLRANTIELASHYLVPLGLKILQSIWSFHQKSSPDWSILKFKAHLCPHSGQQVEGKHFWETYAPIVNWRFVRLILILSILSNLKSHQVDYVNAFTQAPTDCDIYMSIPAGFAVNNGHLVFSCSRATAHDYVLCIKKNMYDSMPFVLHFSLMVSIKVPKIHVYSSAKIVFSSFTSMTVCFFQKLMLFLTLSLLPLKRTLL